MGFVMIFSDCIFHRRMVFLPLLILTILQIIIQCINLVFFIVYQENTDLVKRYNLYLYEVAFNGGIQSMVQFYFFFMGPIQIAINQRQY